MQPHEAGGRRSVSGQLRHETAAQKNPLGPVERLVGQLVGEVFHFGFGRHFHLGHGVLLYRVQLKKGDSPAADCHALVYAASSLDICTGYLGFHSRASFCASAISAGVILAAICSRPSRRMQPHEAGGRSSVSGQLQRMTHA